MKLLSLCVIAALTASAWSQGPDGTAEVIPNLLEFSAPPGTSHDAELIFPVLGTLTNTGDVAFMGLASRAVDVDGSALPAHGPFRQDFQVELDGYLWHDQPTLDPGESYTGYFFNLIIRADYPSFEKTLWPKTSVESGGIVYQEAIDPLPFTVRWTSVVPEPSTFLTLVLGAAVIVRKRRKGGPMCEEADHPSRSR